MVLTDSAGPHRRCHVFRENKLMHFLARFLQDVHTMGGENE